MSLRRVKQAEFHWDHPALAAFERGYSSGEHLFHQGEVGNSLFIITQGLAQIVAEDRGKERSLSVVGAGDLIGEQSLMNPEGYKRAFSVRARGDMKAVCLKRSDLEALSKRDPHLGSEILYAILRTAALRLQRANQVIQILRPSKNVTRFVNLVAYFAEVASRPSSEGKEVLLTKEGIRFYIDMNDFEIESCLAELESKGLVRKRSEDVYLVTNEEKLRNSVKDVQDALPMITVI